MTSKIKAAITLTAGTLSAWLGILAVPMGVLIGLNLSDYITGLMAAKYRGQTISSYKGFRGIAKKVCMWLLVGVGAVVDWLLLFAGETVGLTIRLKFAVASIVAIWLICNELISILENIQDIGVPLPPFLVKLIQKIKNEAESKGEDEEHEDNKENDLEPV